MGSLGWYMSRVWGSMGWWVSRGVIRVESKGGGGGQGDEGSRGWGSRG